jgi:glutathione peroxidase
MSRSGSFARALRSGLLLGLGVLFTLSLSAATNIYEFTLPSIDGQPLPLEHFKGKVILLVNVASQCGYTPQYSALEALYEKYKDRGFVILGFPANNFAGQEPGTNQEIKTFCSRKYSVSFPLYAKISVKGPDQAPLYHFLTEDTRRPLAGEIQWNFTKFLIDRRGQVVARFEPAVTPDADQVVRQVEKLLNP